MDGMTPLASGPSAYPEVPGWMADQWSRSRAVALATRLSLQQRILSDQQDAANSVGGGVAKLGGQAAWKFGATTLSRHAATAGGAVPATTAQLDSDATSGILGEAAPYVGPILSIAGGVYGGYEGLREASHFQGSLRDALANGFSPEDEAAARQKEFNAGMVKAGIGSVLGALTGDVAGGVAGASGGLIQSFKAERNFPDALHAFGQFVRNPLKR